MEKRFLVLLISFFILQTEVLATSQEKTSQKNTDKTAIENKPITIAENKLATLQGITVTATRTERDTFQVPESVSIINMEQIQRNQAAGFIDLFNDIPNVDIAGGPRNIGANINIRGLDDSRILFLMDGARQDFNRAHNSRLFLDPELIKQIEIVRGPASAVWGTGALGGVVAFTTRDGADFLQPGKRIGARIKGGFQSANEQGIGSGSLYGTIGSDFDYLLDFSYRNAIDTRLGDGSRLQHSGFESYSSLAKFNWNPGLYHQFMFSAQTFDQAGGVPSNAQIASTPETIVSRDTAQRNFSLRYRYDNPDKRLIDPEILVFHNFIETDENRRFDGRRDATDFTTTGINARNSSSFNWYNQRIQHVLTYGIDYFHNSATAKRNGQLRPGFPKGSTDVVGIYLQDETTFWDRLTIVPGIRWDYYNNQASGIQSTSNDSNEVSYKIGGILRITDWLSINSAYNEAFRAPNLGELYTTGTHFVCGPGCANLFVPNPNLKPEKAHNVDAGFRLHKEGLFFADDSIQFRGTYFHNKVKNFIDLLVNFSPAPLPGNLDSGGVTTSDNVRNAVLEGYEAELSYEALYGYSGLAYTQTRGRNKTDGGALSNVLADRWIVRAGLNWPVYHLSLGWRSSIVEAQNRVPEGGTPTPAYTVHDIMLTWAPRTGRFKNARVDFGIDNLTDKDYRRHLSLLKDPGRNYKASISYRF